MHRSPLGYLRRVAAGASLLLWVVAGLPVGATDADEAACLARAIYHEARGEDRAGRVAVAHAVLNRRGQPQFKATICEVIRQGAADGSAGCQFSWACDGRSDAPRNEALLAEIRAIAEEVLAGRTSDPTDGAMWFHATDVDAPPWTRELQRTTTLGSHVFYRERRTARTEDR